MIFGLYLLSFATALLTALVFRGRYRNDEPFVLELPPYRLPTLRQIALRGWHEVRHFLRRATRFIIAGVMLVWLLTHLPAGAAPGGPETFAGMLGRFAEPVLAPIGIDERLTMALIFGFVAKEILIGALAVIFGLEGQALATELAARIDGVQATLVHAVHADLHALRVDDRDPALGGPQHPVRAGLGRLVAGARVAGELRVLPVGAGVGLVTLGLVSGKPLGRRRPAWDDRRMNLLCCPD